jgi:hypothetical protein
LPHVKPCLLASGRKGWSCLTAHNSITSHLHLLNHAQGCSRQGLARRLPCIQVNIAVVVFPLSLLCWPIVLLQFTTSQPLHTATMTPACYSSSCRTTNPATLPSTAQALARLNCLSPGCRARTQPVRTRMEQVRFVLRVFSAQAGTRVRRCCSAARRFSSSSARVLFPWWTPCAVAPPTTALSVQLNPVCVFEHLCSASGSQVDRTAAPAPAKPNGIPASSFMCYSPTMQCTEARRCLSPRCRHNTSYWRCRTVRRMLARVQICCSLRCQSVSPFASFVPRALHGSVLIIY